MGLTTSEDKELTDLFEFPLQKPMGSRGAWSVLDANGFLVFKANNETKVGAIHAALNKYAETLTDCNSTK